MGLRNRIEWNGSAMLEGIRGQVEGLQMAAS